jgi:hypothetical protein
LGWRRAKEVLGGDATADDEIQTAPPPAVRFLRGQWVYRGAPTRAAVPEPAPTSPDRPTAAFPARPTDVTAAQRMRLYRERQANGDIPVVVTVNEVGWEVALTEAGFLTDPDPDKKAIGEALSVMLDRLLHADLSTLLLRRNGP